MIDFFDIFRTCSILSNLLVYFNFFSKLFVDLEI